MPRTLIALAAATALAVPLIAVPAASASTSDPYCFYNEMTLQYIASAPISSQVPMTTTCNVTFDRINFEKLRGVGYYEYKVATGPQENMDLCLKVDPGISHPDGNPVVDYTCSTDGGNTQNEEEWSDPPYPSSIYDVLNNRMFDSFASAGSVLWDSQSISNEFELCVGPCTAASALVPK
jgi:hypothetical protein